MSTKVKAKHQAVANPLLAQASAERAFSGAWGTHNDKRNKRARTRAASKTRSFSEF